MKQMKQMNQMNQMKYLHKIILCFTKKRVLAYQYDSMIITETGKIYKTLNELLKAYGGLDEEH